MSQQSVHFNHLLAVRYQKFVFCGKCVVKMENSPGECAQYGTISSNLKVNE